VVLTLTYLKPKLKIIGKNSVMTIPLTRSQLSSQESAPTTRPEIEFLLCCCRTLLDPTTEERVQELIQQDIDWTYLVQISSYQGVMPLLYQNLKATCLEVVPRSIWSGLRNHFHANALRNLYLSEELLSLLKLFAEHRISVIPFKGPVLATSIYHDLELRQFDDLDILVNPKDIIKVREVLVGQDYQLELDLGWQQTFIHREKEITVDLHSELTPFSDFPFKFPDFETLWQRTQILSFHGESIPDFCPDILLIILAVQVARGGFESRESLAQICDLAELIHLQQTLDWEKLLQQVRIWGLDRPFSIGLQIVQTLLNPPLPAIVKQAIRQRMQIDPVISIYAVRMQKQLFSEINSSRIMTLFFQHLMIRGPISEIPYRLYLPWQFLVFTIRIVITNTNQADREFLPLPPTLFFLYYLIRPIRLVRRYGLKHQFNQGIESKKSFHD
jgi:hypothetical protein